jgi:transcriptional regulator with XRE-family HTH domain
MREWLLAERKKAGMTQLEVAKKLDISEAYYSYIESGDRQKKMDVTLVAKLSVVFGIPVSQIVDMETGGGG